MAAVSSNLAQSENDAFQEAKDKFLKQLSTRDRTSFFTVHGPEELISHVQRLANTFSNKRKGAKLLGMANTLRESLEPYFEALGVIAQGASGYAAVAWGVLRLVLQVSQNTWTFYEMVDG
jgi:hypothetical protein